MTQNVAFADSDRIASLDIDDADLPPPTPELDQERRVAVFELVEENRFQPVSGGAGPFDVALSASERRLRLVATPTGGEAVEIDVPLGSLRPLIKDYLAVCDSYYDAVRSLPPSQIEAMDQTRREMHREGAAALRKRMAEGARVDEDTARRLFTLLCALVGPAGGGA